MKSAPNTRGEMKTLICPFLQMEASIASRRS